MLRRWTPAVVRIPTHDISDSSGLVRSVPLSIIFAGTFATLGMTNIECWRGRNRSAIPATRTVGNDPSRRWLSTLLVAYRDLELRQVREHRVRETPTALIR